MRRPTTDIHKRTDLLELEPLRNDANSYRRRDTAHYDGLINTDATIDMRGQLTTRDDGADEEKCDCDPVLGKDVNSPGEEELGNGPDDRLIVSHVSG